MEMFITVTGNINVIRKEHMQVMKDNAIMCNAGHFDVEINKNDLRELATSIRRVRDNTDEYLMPDGENSIYWLKVAWLICLPVTDILQRVMDLSFSLQALSPGICNSK